MRWHLKKDGARIFVDGVLRAIQNDAGVQVGYVKILRDIFPDLARQRVIASILDATPDAISIKDCEDRFAFVNSRLAKLLGKPVTVLIGQRVDEILPVSMAQAMREDDKACMTLRLPHVTEEHLLSADQGVRTLLI